MRNFSHKKKIVIKVGTSSLIHKETGRIKINHLEMLVRQISDIQNQGHQVILVSSGAIGVGRGSLTYSKKEEDIRYKQALAAIGQTRLMMMYQKFFSEYNHLAGQILMTKNNVEDEVARQNIQNTFKELLNLNVIPIVNENDTISTHEIRFGDNDTLSAVVATLVEADLLILLSDIDGLFTDDPNVNPDAKMISQVDEITEELMSMGKDSNSLVGTGGMSTKLSAARLSTSLGVDMIIANGSDFRILEDIMKGEEVGTLFVSKEKDETYLKKYISQLGVM